MDAKDNGLLSNNLVSGLNFWKLAFNPVHETAAVSSCFIGRSPINDDVQMAGIDHVHRTYLPRPVVRVSHEPLSLEVEFRNRQMKHVDIRFQSIFPVTRNHVCLYWEQAAVMTFIDLHTHLHQRRSSNNQ